MPDDYPLSAGLQCPWPLTWDDDVVLYCTPPDGLTDPQKAAEIQAASEAIWWLTGRQYGVCTSTFRFGRQHCCPILFDDRDGSIYPHRGQSLGAGQPRSGGPWLDSIDLDPTGQRPVANVLSVKINGAEVTGWQVQSRRWLQRIPSGARWPVGSDASSATDGLEVQWKWGILPPSEAIMAAAWLACELAKAVLTPSKCALPDKVITAQREGVTVAFIDLTKLTDAGGTGIQRIDTICHRLWPYGLQSAPTVVDPEDIIAAAGAFYTVNQRSDPT